MNFDHILNWRLLSGSHDFPGPDGGTCINEAAIIAAGFEYKSVKLASDCPPCFSRVLSTYAIQLNDGMSDDQRQELLMPFVTRLAGTADSENIERQRFDCITLGLIREVFSISLRGWRDDLADQCAAIVNYPDAVEAINKIAHTTTSTITVTFTLTFAHALAHIHTRTRDRTHQINIAAVGLLDKAMKIGRQPKAIDAATVADRFAKIKEQA